MQALVLYCFSNERLTEWLKSADFGTPTSFLSNKGSPTSFTSLLSNEGTPTSFT